MSDKHTSPTVDVQAVAQDSDNGARAPQGALKLTISITAIVWSLFQLWIVSPFPFLEWPIVGSFGIFNDTEVRSIHLAFAVFLGFLCYPAFKHSPKHYVPLIDLVIALLAAFSAAYIYIYYRELSTRSGAPTTTDIIASIVGVLLLLEATRRTLGPPLVVVASVFLFYVFAGPYMPSLIAHKGASLDIAANHLWVTTEGVFGIALGVSSSFVFLFVLFGALLDKAGAGNYFIQVAFSLLGHMKGGPAKAAVVASGLTGLISGSSIANVVTTGTFTIPMMKRVGFTAEKAGAVEVASSVNGQIMPPVMGAAAFLMVEYVGLTYVEVITHAFLPALISYIALVYIVHLEALKAGMSGIAKTGPITPLLTKLSSVLFGFLCVSALSALVYYGLGWIKPTFGNAASWIIGLLLIMSYVGLVRISANVPDLALDDPNSKIVTLPDFKTTAKSGLHFILPVVVLVWCLMVERLSPGLSAFWASLLMMFILITQKPLFAWFRGQQRVAIKAALGEGWQALLEGLISGARNMIGIGIATATAGIIVGVVSLTGVGSVLADVVETLSMGNLFLMLVLTALLSLILGMGLPTTANYIVVSSLLAPVIVTLGQESGLIVPLIAVHLFVFYFGIMADVTPPVGLASFAAAAVSGGDPIKTGFVAFFYSLRTAMLPFLFIFNTDLLLIDVEPLHAVLVFVISTLGMLVFTAATQGFLLVRCKPYEIALLLLVAFSLFRPGFWMDRIVPPYQQVSGASLQTDLIKMPHDQPIKLFIQGQDQFGDNREFVTLLALPEGNSVPDRVSKAGLDLLESNGQTIIDMVSYGSTAAKAGLSFDQVIQAVEVPNEQPAKEWIFIPAIGLLALILQGQRRRKALESSVNSAPITA